MQLHNSSDGATLGDTLVSTSQISLPEVGHREQWELAVPAQLDDDWLGALDVGVDSGAEFMLGAWIDDDQDWAFDEGEMVVGAREELLVYVAGDPGVDLSAAGYAAGWHIHWSEGAAHRFPEARRLHRFVASPCDSEAGLRRAHQVSSNFAP